MKTYTGVITTTRRGTGFVAIEGLPNDVRIEREHLHTALHGDVVEIVCHKGTEESELTGEVTRVISREKELYVGTVDRQTDTCFVVPDDKRMYVDIVIPNPPQEVETNSKVLVRLTTWTDPSKGPIGEIVEVLGVKGTHEVEMRAILLDKGIDPTFPKPVLGEAADIYRTWKERAATEIEEEIKSGRRTDVRGVTTFTIDPKTAKDFDDAISIEPMNENTWRVGVHIADVSHYVQPGTELDREASERGFSTYLVDRTIPMLPVELSNDICSLNPNVDRLAFSAFFSIELKHKTVTISDQSFGKSVIHSDHRFTYEDAQTALQDETASFHTELTILNTLAQALRAERFKKGAIDFEQDEYVFTLDANGVPTAITRKERLDTHKLVEEFMLLANQEVAREIFMRDKQLPTHVPKGFLYRIHDLPNHEKLHELGELLRALDIPFDFDPETLSAKTFNTLFKHIAGTPVENLIKTASIRTMAKAAYSTTNVGHFGLGFGFYTHFTSPIRRYADLIVHRLLHEHLLHEHPKKDTVDHYKTLALKLSQKEIRIQEAERDSIRYKQIEYMLGHLGSVFDGIIVGIQKWGMYVEDRNTGAEGLVSVRSLKDDFYVFDERHHRLKGEKTKRTFTLGDPITVQVKNVNLDRRELDLEFMSRD